MYPAWCKVTLKMHLNTIFIAFWKKYESWNLAIVRKVLPMIWVFPYHQLLDFLPKLHIDFQTPLLWSYAVVNMFCKSIKWRRGENMVKIKEHIWVSFNPDNCFTKQIILLLLLFSPLLSWSRISNVLSVSQLYNCIRN